MSRKRPRIEDIYRECSLVSKKAQEIKQDVLYFADSWNRQFPVRLAAGCFAFLTAEETATAYGTCKSWQSVSKFMDRFWREKYEQDWEISTAQDPRIANAGPDTPWMQRYKRRWQTEQNLRSGSYTVKRMESFVIYPSDWIYTDSHGQLILIRDRFNISKGEFQYTHRSLANPYTTDVAYGMMVLANEDNITCLDIQDLRLKFHRPTRYHTHKIQIANRLILSGSRDVGLEMMQADTGQEVAHIKWPESRDFFMTTYTYDEASDILFVCGVGDEPHWNVNMILRVSRASQGSSGQSHRLKIMGEAQWAFWSSDVLYLDKQQHRLLLVRTRGFDIFDMESLELLQTVDREGASSQPAFSGFQETRTTFFIVSYPVVIIVDKKTLKAVSTVHLGYLAVRGYSPLEILMSAAGLNAPLVRYDFTPPPL